LVKGIEPKSQVAIAFTGPFEYSEANRLLLRAVTGLLQTKLSEAIREDLGATYSIGVTQTTQPVPFSTYDIRIQWSCAPQRVGDLTRRVFEEVKSLTETTLSEFVVGSVRTTLEREMQRSLQQNNYVLAQLVLKYQLDLDPAEIWTYPAHLQALTARSIRAAAERYLDTKRYVQVTLMPEGDRPATAAALGRATVPGREQP
jgi:zinc protease